ncbi:MAG TPA: response regulator [Candidatus Marinimicrobia bacterium]|nr:response regulator [Candidatus Neomarinimicrobiota bacterium]
MDKKTILLVEDEVFIALDEKEILENYNFNVISVSTGEKAVQAVEENPDIDLILMDINLGEGMDGTEAAKRILENHDLPLIFISSHTEREVVEKTEGITSYGYIVKYSGETVLIQSIKMAFRLFDATLRKWEKEELQLKSMVLDQITDHVTITDTNGVITYVNKIQEKDLKIPKEELIGNPTVIYGENPARGATQKEIITKTLEQGHWRGEVVNYAADGREIVLDCRTQVIRDKEGNPISLCGISTDITEQKKTEERLLKSESLQNLILSAIPDMLMRFDGEGRYLDIINYRDNELVTPKESLIGKSVSSIIPGELGIKLENSIRSVVKTGKMEKIEYGLDVPAGHCYFEARIIPFTENEAISLIRNITEKKKVEKTLEESEEKYRLLVEKAHDGIDIAQDDLIIFCNQQFADMLGYTVKELKNISFLDIYTEEGTRQLYERQKLRLAGEFVPNHYTTTFKKKDGTVIDVDVNYEITEYRNRPATFATIRDITEKKKAENRIHALLNEKEVLLQETHHRIKNNMATIKSLLMLQAKVQNNPEASNILNDAAGRVQSMAVLYNKLCRSEAYLELSIKDFLPSLISEIMLLFPQPVPIRTKIELEDIILDAKTLSVLGIILNECITNSMKHAFHSVEKPEISIQIYKTVSGTKLTYKDNGPGMASTKKTDNSSTFGFQLLSMMISQLNGIMEIQTQNGMTITFEF